MKTILALTLASACGAVLAQSPAANPMPDGSRDMYAGVGIVSSPEYPGASDRRLRGQPLIQVQWSSGIFISAMSAGMHLSQRPTMEFGPLLAIQSGRNEGGMRNEAGEVTFGQGLTDPGRLIGNGIVMPDAPEGLKGMTEVKARLQGGAFFNYYLTPNVRLTNSLLYGAGNERDGLIWNAAVQRIAPAIAGRHRFSWSAGMNVVNRSYNATFFGVSDGEAPASGYEVYAPRGGVKDVYVGAGWNMALSPSWMITSSARFSGLVGDARRSPLVQRSTNLTVSTGLAYRF